MNNVISIDEYKEKNKYTEFGGVIHVPNGLTMISKPECTMITVGYFHVEFESRKDLAEWLWMAVRMVDSDGRFEKSEYVGMNYDD